jgi:hypothetical protein
MIHNPFAQSDAPNLPGGTDLRWPARRSAVVGADPSAQDRAFINLQQAYRSQGGFLRLPDRSTQRASRDGSLKGIVESLMDAGELFGFHWYNARWVPLFQFDRGGQAVAGAPRRVVAELGGRFDGWDMAGWFVRPNSSLDNHAPIECLSPDLLPRVLDAARADRLVLSG